MYIAVCDDQADELELLTDLLYQWQEAHGVALPFKSYRSAAELLTAPKTSTLRFIY